MFDKAQLHEVLIQYKQNFVSMHWGNENISGKLSNAFRIIGT